MLNPTTNRLDSCLWLMIVWVPETAPDTPCRQRLRIWAVAAAVVVELATAPTAQVRCPSCVIQKRSGFAFHCSQNSKALSDWSQSSRVWVAGLQRGGSVDKPSVQLFVVKDCSGPDTAPDTPCW